MCAHHCLLSFKRIYDGVKTTCNLPGRMTGRSLPARLDIISDMSHGASTRLAFRVRHHKDMMAGLVIIYT